MKTCKQLLSLALSILFVVCTVAGATVASFAADAGEATPTVTCTNCASEITLGYKDTKTFDFEAANLPEDASVHVFRNNEDCGETLSYTFEDATEDYTVEAKVLDQNGAVLATSGVITVTVKNGFLDRAKVFLEDFTRSSFDGIMDFLSAIFMRIYVRVMNLFR